MGLKRRTRRRDLPVNLGNVATRRRSKVSIEEYEGMLLLDLDDVGAGVRVGASAGQGHWWAAGGGLAAAGGPALPPLSITLQS